ncbi:YbaB/EbfC family nucleoid-associated protein [Glycomyces niveus]|uniref:YbaB/EbfC family nucleoid-associated protein n=1 Tax=Glycomyces niveus TaxID=2820287 RepID=A0ABS3UA08_9ACTN|nr:YbaB/EbfC family nucleoid-associated protein [Glycomyces sp. NEAU-S30]MBO3735609.1 YbaB/EbfC family nucleoid-associated protein [Glycomyces sp. NEAU-S30]
MVGAIPGPEESKERLAAWKGKIDQLAADTQAMSDRMQELRVTVSDPNYMVTVTVDSTGNLLDLQLTERSRRVELQHVSQTIMQTIRTAKAQVAEQAKEIIESTLGEDSAAGRAIAERVRNQLMPPVEPEERW